MSFYLGIGALLCAGATYICWYHKKTKLMIGFGGMALLLAVASRMVG